MEIIDISVPIRPGMVVYEGDPPVDLELVRSLAEGASANLSRLDFGVHSGTHVDAPVHFIDGAPGAEALPLDVLVGLAHVVDATRVQDVLDEAALRGLALPEGAERLIFKTPNSRLWESGEFEHDFVSMNGGGARYLVDRGVRLVGIDYMSVETKRRTSSSSGQASSRWRASICAASNPAHITSCVSPFASSALTVHPLGQFSSATAWIDAAPPRRLGLRRGWPNRTPGLSARRGGRPWRRP